MPGRNNGSDNLMLHCPDILPHSQRSSTRSSPSPDLSPVPLRHSGGGSYTLPSSKSSSRHSVSFQLQNPDQDVLYDSFDQILNVLTPGMTSPRQQSSPGPTWLNVPSTPSSNRRSYDLSQMDEEGKSSVVTFGYIEKANVHSLGMHHPSACQSKSDTRMDGQGLPAHLRKRLSDPVWYSETEQSNCYAYHSYPSRSQSPGASPYLRRATVDAVAREATFKALEEFGSPELRRRFEARGSESSSPSPAHHHQSPRCRSLGGSPVLPRSTLTLPAKAQLVDRGICRSWVNGLPRSPASDHLCAHTGYSVRQSHGQQRSRVGDESRLSSKFHPPLPAGRPTDIQHEIASNVFPANNQLESTKIIHSTHSAADDIDFSDISSKAHYQPSRCSSSASNAVSPTNGRRSISPSSNPELACKLAVEAAKLSAIYADRRTPSPTPSQAVSLRSESPKIGGQYSALQGQMSPEPLQANNQHHRQKIDNATDRTQPGHVSPLLSQKSLPSPSSPVLPARYHRPSASQSPVFDPRQQWSSAPSNDVSTVHRYQQPQYTGDCRSRGIQQRHLYDQSPEVSRRLLSNQDAEVLPVKWTESGLVCADRHSPSRLYTPSKVEDKGVKALTHENRRPVIFLTKDQIEEVQDHSRGAGSSSQSSSGVTGSVGDSSQLDRFDSLSPETMSQSSYDTADSGSGIQVRGL